MYRNPNQLNPAMLCVEFTQVQYIVWSELIHFFESCRHCNKGTLKLIDNIIFVVSHFLIAKVSPEWRLNPGFGIQTDR